MISVLGIQINNLNAVTEKQRDYNLEHARELILSQSGHDLYVLPELSSSGYSEETFRNLPCLAEDIDGLSCRMFSSLAKELKCSICFGFPRICGKEYRITQAVVNAGGEISALYDKMHMAQFGNSREKTYFSQGNRITTFWIGDVKIGIALCYDFRFPEFIREMALKWEIDLLLHPSAFSRDGSFHSWHSFAVTRALENQVYLLSINRAGEEYGQSIFCPPWIDSQLHIVTLGDKEDFIGGQIDLQLIARVRKEYTFRADRIRDL